VKADATSPLSVDEIRPDQCVEEQDRRFRDDIARMLRRAAEFVAVPCPACGATYSAKVFEKHRFTYVECPECQTMYMNPRPSPSVLAEYYSNSENYAYWAKEIFPRSEEARRTKIFRPRALSLVEACRRHGVPLGTVVDVGAGFGTFLTELTSQNAFERHVAIEPTPELAVICRERGLDVIEATAEECAPGLNAAAVTAFEVIEHVFEPRAWVDTLGRMLMLGGLMMLTCPNVDGFEIGTLRELSTSVDPEHLNYFNPRSLSGLLERCGFEVLQVSTPGRLDAELVRRQAVGGKLDLTDNWLLKRVLLEAWNENGERFQQMLAGSGLSSHMSVVARNRADSAKNEK
jgi:SAM-dependent methyltransferase